MPGLFGPMRLIVDRAACDLSRVSSQAGINLIADHDATAPLGRCLSARIDSSTRTGYAEIELVESSRNAWLSRGAAKPVGDGGFLPAS